MIVYRVGNYLDDSLDQFYVVFLLVSDGVLRLADILQSENLFFLLNFSSSPCLLDRRAVLLTSNVLSPWCCLPSSCARWRTTEFR